MKRICSLLTVMLLSGSCFVGEETPSDQEVWEYALPSEVGMSDEWLLNLDTITYFGNFDPVRSMIIIKDDKLVFENYYVGDDRSTIRSLLRSTPMLVILAVGIAFDEGWIPRLDIPVQSVLGNEYDDIFNANALKREITIEDILTHRSGFSWNENITSLQNSNNDLNVIVNSNDMVRFVLEKDMEASPGVRFNYNTGTATVLAKIVEEVSGQSFTEFVEERIFTPLGITDYVLTTDPAGNVNAATGLSLRTLDVAKIGYLYLQEGRWQNDRIVSSQWVQTLSSPQSIIADNVNYGYFWQVFSDNITFIPLFQPNDTYFFSQHIYINPSQNLLITFSTENITLNLISNPMFLYSEVVRPLVP